MMFKVIDGKRARLLIGLKIDNLIRWGEDEWRGEANDGELYIRIFFKSLIVQVALEEVENNCYNIKPILAWTMENMGERPNIYQIMDCLKIEYEPDEVWDTWL